jgi:hypothetical protein
MPMTKILLLFVLLLQYASAEPCWINHEFTTL